MSAERIRLKDTTCPIIRLESARKRDKSISFSLSLAVHLLIFSLVGISLISPTQFGVDKGDGGIEVDLVAASVETSPQEIIEPQIEAKSDFVQEEMVKPQPVLKNEPTVASVGKDQVTVQSSGGAITESKPDYLKNPAPVYPDAARRRGQEGVVILTVLVDKTGHPQKVDISKSSGSTLLDKSAVEAVGKWTFQPAKLGAIPVESQVDIPIRFLLKEK